MNNPRDRATLLTIGAYVFCALVWGTSWYAIRLCVQEGGFSICTAGAFRFSIAVLLILLTAPLFKNSFPPLDKTKYTWILLAGLLNAFGVGLIYWGETYISGGMAAVLVATTPIMVAIAAIVSKAEKITLLSVLGSCLALFGIAIIFSDSLQISTNNLLAMSAMLLSALCFAMANFIMKVKAGSVKPMQSTFIFAAILASGFWGGILLEGGKITWASEVDSVLALFYLALLCTVAAFPLFFYLLRNSSLMVASSLAFVQPVIALFTDLLLENDYLLSQNASWGIGIVLLGLLLTIQFKKQTGIEITPLQECDDANLDFPQTCPILESLPIAQETSLEEDG